MLLIATDEAGYGPKLGPLVIAATVWQVPDRLNHDSLRAVFAPLGQPIKLGDTVVRVNDSKAVYQPSSGLGGLHAAVSASLAWCGMDAGDLESTVVGLCPDDQQAIRETPWLEMEKNVAMLSADELTPLLGHWRSSEAKLVDVRARIITAQKFNEFCSNGLNKADLLSQTTLNLVRDSWQRHSAGQLQTEVYCDRHGGRRYYAGVLQHVIPDAWVNVESETALESVYCLTLDSHTLRFHFTVKGDSFTPVALASMHAKYLRERMMESLNRYFVSRIGDSLKPTAGYPVDADRFLSEITATIEHEQIDRSSLIRSR